MSLLKGSSAFSFNPGSDKEESGGFLNGLLGQEGGGEESEGDDDEDFHVAEGQEGEDDDEMALDMDEMARRSPASSSSYFSNFGRRRSFPSAPPPSPAAGTTASGAPSTTTAMGDYGGDYGDYLRLLEDDTALGFNPQADPITDNQDLQTDVFGGGMSGKYWDMYKGKTSYDEESNLGEEDQDSMEEIDEDEGESSMIARQTPEAYQPIEPQIKEERKLSNKAKEMLKKWGEKRFKKPKATTAKKTPKPVEKAKQNQKEVIISYKPKSEVEKLYKSMMEALAMKDDAKLSDILNRLNIDNLEGKKGKEKRRALLAESKEDEGDDDGDHKNDNTASDSAEKLKQFVAKMTENLPDPITTTKGLDMNYRNLTVKGLSDLTVCEGIKVRGGPSQRKAALCTPLLTASVATSSGPGVPFRGRVTAILRRPRVVVTFRDVDGKDLHFRSAHLELTSKAKYVPNYESSIPLNPWSKVSMSGYMVSRVKKALPTALDKTLLKLLHVVEKLKL